jgi:hypothetical protein
MSIAIFGESLPSFFMTGCLSIDTYSVTNDTGIDYGELPDLIQELAEQQIADGIRGLHLTPAHQKA